MSTIFTFSVTHANFNTEVELAIESFVGAYHSPNNNCTHVIGTGGTIFPAKESKEEVINRYIKSKTLYVNYINKLKEENNANSTN